MRGSTGRFSTLDEAQLSRQWFEPFGRLLLATVPIDSPTGTVLDVVCASGGVSLALVERLDSRGRVVALDPTSPLLDIARDRSGALLGKRLFFRHERPERLSFTDDVFDLVVSNAGVLELPDPDSALAECVRVLKPGGALTMTGSLRGTFQELLDLFREVLERHERDALVDRLDQHIRSYPSDNEAIARFEGLGLRDVHLTRSAFSVTFPSGHDFMESALVAYRFLPRWREIVGEQDARQIFHEIVSTIDTYFGTDTFELTVQAACVIGRKEEYDLIDYETAEAPDSGPSTTPQDPQAMRRAAAAGGGGAGGAADAGEEPEEPTPVRKVAIPPEAAVNGSAPDGAAPASGGPPPLPGDPERNGGGQGAR